MQLKIAQNLEGNKVRLDYKSSPSKPDYAPSYVIDKENADEFIKKYNKQENSLLNITVLLSALGGIGAGFLSTKNKGYKSKLKILKPVISVPAGISAGLILSSVISSVKKNDLMDKYHVKKL